jgi:hypothetical protein
MFFSFSPGITQEQVDVAPTLEEALEDVMKWFVRILSTFKLCFVKMVPFCPG